jgi:hypothetical protein
MMNERDTGQAETDEPQGESARKPWHKPAMEILPVSQSENFITTHTDSVASANS